MVLCWCFDLWGYSLSPKTCFFKIVYVSGIVTIVKFTYPDHFLVHVILSRVISLFMLVFLYRFLSGKFCRGCFTCTICIIYNVYISQEYREAWYVYWTAIRYCMMLHFQIILFIQPAWWMDFNCSIDILFLYISHFTDNLTQIDDIIY